ncbi:MAG: DUF3744 domain-containing protein [Treponemataceae bacterium]|nr:MAG: DUF3744 domain-containing protein [Treponemataceae bacterium]
MHDSGTRDTVVSFSDFSFCYESQNAPTLQNIDFAVRAGEKILITGTSGSGKSTLAHCINSLIPNSFRGKQTGSVSVKGTVGTVMQDTDAQFIGLTAAEDIAFALENDMVEQGAMKTLVVEAAKMVEIEHRLSSDPHKISGGQKQRVSLAGIIVSDVDILLFDEPLANLDPKTGESAIELIDRIAEESGKTVIIIEHRIEDVLHCKIDRIAVMNEGRIIADGAPSRVIAQNVFRLSGLREPLYISALRNAHCTIADEAHIESVHTIQFDTKKLVAHYSIDRTANRTVDDGLIDENLPNPENTGALLRVENVSFRYDSQEPASAAALGDASFAIPRGLCTAVCGKNGSGKSTFAHLVCGFLQPSSGRIFFDDADISVLSIKERGEKIGYVMQNPNHMISFPMVYDEAAFVLRNRKLDETQVKEKVDEVLKICSLYGMRNWPVNALSYGQKKRLTIASVLVGGAHMLVLDEPTAGQDLKTYTEIMRFLTRLKIENGLTLLIITHDMHLMLEYADNTIVFADGKILCKGDTPSNVLTNDEIIQKAYLKKTSLYTLAERAMLPDASAFVKAAVAETKRTEKGGE